MRSISFVLITVTQHLGGASVHPAAIVLIDTIVAAIGAPLAVGFFLWPATNSGVRRTRSVVTPVGCSVG